jgi:hypothetical protein
MRASKPNSQRQVGHSPSVGDQLERRRRGVW